MPGAACATLGDTTAISVSADSAAGTVSGYNLLHPVNSGPLYNWAGISYPDLSTFQSATHQGGNDINSAPGIGSTLPGKMTMGYGQSAWWTPPAGSPAIDSANADAPGALTTDQLGNPRADDPDVANTGAGSGDTAHTSYFDRGAVEVEGPVSDGGRGLTPSGPLAATAAQHMTTAWPANGPIGMYSYDFGDSPFPVVTTATSVPHLYSTAGSHSVSLRQVQGGGGTPAASVTASTQVGAGYQPVTPVRILDTRNGTGVAMVANVTATRTTKPGYLTVYASGMVRPVASNLNFLAAQTVPNLVISQLGKDGAVAIYNGSPGGTDVIVDEDGYFIATSAS